MQNNNFDLDTPILKFSGGDEFTIRNSIEGGVCIFGASGTGKTSTTSTLLAQRFLCNGYAGIVLTVKASDIDDWRGFCRQTGRSKDLIVVAPGPDAKHFFNFLQYECQQQQEGVSIAQNICSLLESVIEGGQEQSGGKENEAFFASAQKMLVSSVVELALLGFGTCTVQTMFDIAVSAPKSDENGKAIQNEDSAFRRVFQAAQKQVKVKVNAYLATLPEAEKERLNNADLLDASIIENVPDFRTLLQIDQFFVESYRNLAPRTRGAIEFGFIGLLFQLLKEPFYTLFSSKPSSFTPEDCYNGKVIVLALPVKLYNETAKTIQAAIKFCFQRAWERRIVAENSRPLFIWSDEAQHFLTGGDPLFLSASRSSRVSSVYISQNIVGYYSAMSGAKFEYKVKALLGLFSTKIFHANSCHDTNKFASELIGEDYMKDMSTGVQIGENVSQSFSERESLRKRVLPEKMTPLLTGGPKNGYFAEAYLHRQGTPFKNGRNYKKIRIKQQSPSLNTTTP